MVKNPVLGINLLLAIRFFNYISETVLNSNYSCYFYALNKTHYNYIKKKMLQLNSLSKVSNSLNLPPFHLVNLAIFTPYALTLEDPGDDLQINNNTDSENENHAGLDVGRKKNSNKDKKLSLIHI